MSKIFKLSSFPCKQCGASLVFCSKTNALQCEYCETSQPIKIPNIPIVEHDLKHALQEIENSPKTIFENKLEVNCTSCKGHFVLSQYQRSTKCPYCSTPIITNLDTFYNLTPESLLPFSITQKSAKTSFKKWLGSLWFAPNSLNKYFQKNSKLHGTYIPYWTYDSNTHSEYQGKRGDIYYVTVTKNIVKNGRMVRVNVQEQRIDWSYASGSIDRFFDDILIGASSSLPRLITKNLSPWDLENLVPYDSKYLSGFESETYQVSLDNGFIYAKEIMDYWIKEDVRRDIGGDKQQIDNIKTNFNDLTFKYLLLPIWIGNYKYKNKNYQFAINGRTGQVTGDRPYSYTKIFFAVITGVSITLIPFVVDDFSNSGYQNFSNYIISFF